MSKVDSPKEIIAIATISKWDSIKGFLKKLVEKTLNKKIGYEVVIINNQAKSSSKKEYNFSIKEKEHFKKLEKISKFDHISLYQSNGYINNHVDVTKENDIIVILAKYMGPEIKHIGDFDFSIYLDSSASPYFTISDGESRINCQDLLNIFNEGVLEYKKPEIKEISDEKLEEFIFEKISGKNAVWGGSETKLYKAWKNDCSELFKKKTEKNPYYGRWVTKNYSDVLVKMFNLWYVVSNKLEDPSDSTELKELEKFLGTF